MTRRFFLVAIDRMPCGVQHDPEIIRDVLFEHYRDIARPVVIPVDKVTAVVGAIWAGVDPRDVLGTQEPHEGET